MSQKGNAEVVEVLDPESITIAEVVDLEPITIGEVTEVTGSGNGGNGDFVVVWGC